MMAARVAQDLGPTVGPTVGLVRTGDFQYSREMENSSAFCFRINHITHSYESGTFIECKQHDDVIENEQNDDLIEHEREQKVT
jgi:hypothetical protein